MNSPSNKKFSESFRRRVFVVILIMLFIAIIGILYRIIENRKLRRITHQQAALTVSVIEAHKEPVDEEIVLPGNVAAWHESTIYARTNGYLINWMVDIGAK